MIDLEEAAVPMKRVYLLSEELRVDRKQVELTRKLTLDKSRPHMGLKGSFGLFASEIWWDNINRRKMPLRLLRGPVARVYEAGQDQEGINNTVDLSLENGTVIPVGIYVNDPVDIDLFKVGSWVVIVYALDELKDPSTNLGDKHAQVSLEMAVSLERVT
jgi:hypothetical protein